MEPCLHRGLRNGGDGPEGTLLLPSPECGSGSTSLTMRGLGMRAATSKVGWGVRANHQHRRPHPLPPLPHPGEGRRLP